MEDELDRACSTNGGRRGMNVGYWRENQEEKETTKNTKTKVGGKY
jgi:hypothetical protein